MSQNEYVEGEFYEGLGKYSGIIKVYPHGKDYFLKKHKFVENIPKEHIRAIAKIKEVFIEKIKRDDR